MRSELDDKELESLITALLVRGGAATLDELLKECHRFHIEDDRLQPYERYFRLELSYQGFEVFIPEVVINGTDVMAASVQFKRPSTRQPIFMFPWTNPNRQLVKRLRKLVSSCYQGELGTKLKWMTPPPDENSFRGDVERIGSQIHFPNERRPFNWTDCTFEESVFAGCETAIFDEPYSAGQTPKAATPTRNDFVILRFKRKV